MVLRAGVVEEPGLRVTSCAAVDEPAVHTSDLIANANLRIGCGPVSTAINDTISYNRRTPIRNQVVRVAIERCLEEPGEDSNGGEVMMDFAGRLHYAATDF